MTTPSQGAWSKSPKFIMRAAAIAVATRHWTPGPFVEFGVGTGTMTRQFVDRGFTGTVYDVGEATLDYLRRNVFPPGGPVTVVDDPDEVPPSSADYLFAFEVLEHVPDDLGVLKRWTSVLRPNGRVLISVPAHQRKFSDIDRRVGHVRRYEKDALATLLSSARFGNIRIINYGYPLGNITRRVMSRFEQGDDGHMPPAEQLERSVRSGIEQPKLVNMISRVVNERTLAPFIQLQRRYFDRDLGDGYVAVGQLLD